MKIGNVFDSSGSKIGEVHSDSEGGSRFHILNWLRTIFVISVEVFVLKEQVLPLLIAEWNKNNILCIETYGPMILVPFVSFVITWAKTTRDNWLGLTARRVVLFICLTFGLTILAAVVSGIHQYGLFTGFMLGLKHFLSAYVFGYLIIFGLCIITRMLYTALGGY